MAALGGPIPSEAQIAFEALAPLSSGNERPSAVALGDLDQDGHLDIAVANYGPSSQPPFGGVSVLWGNGDGSFSVPQNWQDGVVPHKVAIADVDADTHLDVVFGDNNGPLKVVWGTGGRSPGDVQTLSQIAVADVAIADIDGDGDADVLSTPSEQSLQVHYNNGARTFASGTFPAGQQPNQVVVGHLDGDARLDVAVAEFWVSTLSILLGSAGGFTAPTTLPAGILPTDVAIGEFTGDTLADIAYTRRGCFSAPDCGPAQGCFIDDEWVCLSDGLFVLPGDGVGGLGPATMYGTGEGPGALETGDFNQDGRLDVVVTNFNSNEVSVFAGQIAGGFAPAENVPVDRGPSGLALGDVNLDGRLDVVVANWRSSTVSVLLGSCAEGLPCPTFTPVPTNTPEQTATETAVPTPTRTATHTPKPISENSLVLSVARLRLDTSPTRANGSVVIRGIVNDNDAAGNLEVSLLANAVTLDVTAPPAFSAPVALTGCVAVGSRGKIRCRSADRQVTALFRPITGPLLYRMKVVARRLDASLTGTVQPIGPVGVILRQNAVDRPDTIDACVQRGSARLVCRES